LSVERKREASKGSERRKKEALNSVRCSMMRGPESLSNGNGLGDHDSKVTMSSMRIVTKVIISQKFYDAQL
jgi:hypothetical protein